METKLLVVVLGMVVAFGRVEAARSCYAENTTPYLFFASKTSYEFVYGRPQPQQTSVPSCEPKQIWIMARHGTRYPNATSIQRMKELETVQNEIIQNHEVRRNGELCFKDLDNLKKWKFSLDSSMSLKLTPQGKEDMKLLAQRFRDRYPSLFNDGYRQDEYEFRFTDTERTRESAQKFAEGLFGDSSSINFPPPMQNDSLIRAYDTCTKWKKTVENDQNALLEEKLFENSQLVKDVIANVSKRLGFLFNLSYRDVHNMYDMCRYEKAWNVGVISPWCAVFSRSELEVLEYKEDLKYYYRSGYGHDINVKLGCPPVKDFMERFSKLAESSQEDTSPRGVFYFTHLSAIQMLESRMGFAKDSQPLTHNSYSSMQKRKWRTSLMTSFSANIAAVFFKCTFGEPNQVMFYISENLADIEGCRVGLCPWNVVKQKFAHIAEECNLEFCEEQKNTAHNIYQSIQHILMSIIILLVINFHG